MSVKVWDCIKLYSSSNFCPQFLATFGMFLAWINYYFVKMMVFQYHHLFTCISWFLNLRVSLILLINLFIYLYQCRLMASYSIQHVINSHITYFSAQIVHVWSVELSHVSIIFWSFSFCHKKRCSRLTLFFTWPSPRGSVIYMQHAHTHICCMCVCVHCTYLQ